MAIKLQDKPNISAPDSDYPYGNIKDKTSTQNGTPLTKFVHADFHQFFAKLLDASGIVATGLPDNLTNGFDYIQALWQFGNSNFVSDLIIGLLGSYTTDDLIVLYGCEVTYNVPGTSSITAGAIYYNRNIYKVAAQPSISSPSDTLVFKINSAIQPNIIYLANGPALSGIANWNSASVKQLYDEIIVNNLNPESWIAPTLSTNWANSGSTNPAGYYKDKVSKLVRLKGLITYTSGANSTDITIFTLPSGYRPAYDSQFIVPFKDNAGSGVVALDGDSHHIVEILTDGTVRLKKYFGTSYGSANYDLSIISFRY